MPQPKPDGSGRKAVGGVVHGALWLALFRHGPAEGRNATLYPDDDARPLNAAGRKKVKAAARGLRALGLAPEILRYSPARRARETAALIADVLHLPAKAVVLEPALHPDADPGVLVRDALRRERASRVMWVGHEPWLGEAVGLLTGAAPVALRKAGLALVEVPAGPRRKGHLRGLVPPEWLAIAGADS
jgi:phosphohistidine phosphatase